MRWTILVGLLLGLSPVAHAKDACSAVKTSKDDWGEKKSFKAGDFRWESSGGSTSLVVAAVKGGWFVAQPNTALPAGATLEVLFTDGTSFSFTTPADVMPGSMYAPYVGLIMWWDIRIPATPEVMSLFSTRTVQAYRVTNAGNDFSKGKLSEGDAAKVMTMSRCFVPQGG